ncbi:MAG: Eco57I restriction-modification methylase domain-containing protein [Paludibacter sp.]|jgi:hypothetical protein|nr:Eco57I restriction-modification methylase domain-containing protein [Paludibacter sp.]
MELTSLTPRLALNKAFLKVKPNRQEIELFKHHLIRMIDTINESESEEFHKNEASKFLQNTYYSPAHYLNTKDRKDLVIHTGATAATAVGVIMEVKKPLNKAEMLKPDSINTKAFQELVLYYLRERITHKNLEIKHLIATNIYEWFIFDAQVFEKLFAQNKVLVKNFVDFEEGRLSGTTTDFFYSEIAAPAIAAISQEITFTYFDIRTYEKPLRNNNPKDDTMLIALYKLLSPQHLLKLPFANDSNSLDKAFYTELLHIIGLTEVKEGSKKLIQRKKEGDRDAGSLLESAILQLDQLDKINRLSKPSQHGNSYDERLFSVALELCITWVNRILFLKLLEAQLIKYHRGDVSYAFLNTEKIRNFDDLNTLFFQVLARKPEDRSESVMHLFAHVPYLNSSLFEPSETEHNGLFISQLADSTISIFPQTVIKDTAGKKRTGEIPVIDYIFDFLNAYDFSSEGSEEIQEDNKRLINASVLGLIFEKINGYKDGSFFTPGFITMYMCSETIRRAVVQKFNDAKGWTCNNFGELYDKIDAGVEARNEANAIVNSLRICDPAVGSGHFLVSALNEMIAIKSELRILQDRDGKRLKEYTVQVENDELIITDDDGSLYEYNPNSKESQRVQETLFHEKQTIIENCLFGVDINPNSVKICRLRLWIELLKNAYYRSASTSGVRELETLPNIDINIKCGNSLISRYALDADIKKALKRSKWTIESYRLAVMQYRNARNKDEKREMEQLITSIKNDFESEVSRNDKRVLQLSNLRGELYNLSNQTSLFELSKSEKAKFNKDIADKDARIEKLEAELEEVRNNRIFENAFEWRFEFPEVLNEDGEFIGFDVVIGNPPYIRQEEFSELKTYLKQRYRVYHSMADLLTNFVELGFDVLKKEGTFQFIISNKFTRANYGNQLRNFLVNETQLTHFIDFSGIQVFDEATVDAAIIGYLKRTDNSNHFIYASITKSNFDVNGFEKHMKSFHQRYSQKMLVDRTWAFETNEVQKIKHKVESQGVPLKDWNLTINYGIKTGLNEAFVIDNEFRQKLIEMEPQAEYFLKPLLRGRDIQKYRPAYQGLWLIHIPKGYTIKTMLKLEEDVVSQPIPRYGYIEYNRAWEWFKSQYPLIAKHLSTFRELAQVRSDMGDYWWEQRACAYLNSFQLPKIIYPNMTKYLPFVIDIDNHFYHNDKSFHILSDRIYWLGAFLNSTLFRYCFRDNFAELLGGTRELRKVFFEPIPVKHITIEEEQAFRELIGSILDLKKQDEQADTTSLESQIDRLVYELYGLTEEEIKIVEGN